MTKFEWTNPREAAAALVAEGRLTNAAICEQVGICGRTLANWKKVPEFAGRVEEHLEAFRAEVRGRGIALLERRVRALSDRWERLLRVIEERAQDVEMADVPGGTTGLIVKQTRKAGTGEDAPAVIDYFIDAALLKELREHEKQAAQELGQWVEQHGVVPFTKTYVTVGPDDL